MTPRAAADPMLAVARERLARQRLVGEPFADPADAVRWLGAVQSQDYAGAKWALALRTRGADGAAIDDAAIDRAFDAGAILRTHILRPTWHFVAPEDLRWMLALTGPRVHVANGSVYRQTELDAATLRRAHACMTRALRDGRNRTRDELAAALDRAGIPARGLRLAAVVMHAELSGLICSGPRRGKSHTYALLEERVPPAPVLDRDEALATLARRYAESHGPATAYDFAWWSGLTVTDARRAMTLAAPAVEPVEIGGTAYWTGASPATVRRQTPVVHLLPNFDEHVVAYRDHGRTLDPAARAARRARGDRPLDAHLVSRNGMIVGGWRRTVGKSSVAVRFDLLVPLGPRERAALRRAAESYARFLGLDAVLEPDA